LQRVSGGVRAGAVPGKTTDILGACRELSEVEDRALLDLVFQAFQVGDLFRGSLAAAGFPAKASGRKKPTRESSCVSRKVVVGLDRLERISKPF
jgi:hypothetical protein